MEEYPLVSICIPTYNGAHLVPRAIESCLRQTYPNIEILVVDDTSKDNTCEVVRGYASRAKNIRLVVNEQNLGASKNFLKTFEIAKGAYVQHLGQDDWLDPNFIEKKILVFKAHPETAFVASAMASYEERGGKVHYLSTLAKREGWHEASYINRRFYKEPGLIGFSCMMRKEDAVSEFMVHVPNQYGYDKYYEKAMVIDNMLMLRILALPQYHGKFFYTSATHYNTLSHEAHFSKDYGWIREYNLDDRIKFAHIDRVGYEYFFRTYAPQYLFGYRVYMGYNMLANVLIDLVRYRKTHVTWGAIRNYLSDYSFPELLASLVFLPFHLAARMAKMIRRKLARMQ